MTQNIGLKVKEPTRECADIANYCMFMFNKLNDEDI